MVHYISKFSGDQKMSYVHMRRKYLMQSCELPPVFHFTTLYCSHCFIYMFVCTCIPVTPRAVLHLENNLEVTQDLDVQRKTKMRKTLWMSKHTRLMKYVLPPI